MDQQKSNIRIPISTVEDITEIDSHRWPVMPNEEFIKPLTEQDESIDPFQLRWLASSMLDGGAIDFDEFDLLIGLALGLEE